MHKAALIIFLLNMLVSNQSEAAGSHNALKPINTMQDACNITRQSGFFALDAPFVSQMHDGYSQHCSRIGMTRTGARNRSSLVIEADGFDKRQWEVVELTMNVDDQKGDIHAESAFREASYKLIGGQAVQNGDEFGNAKVLGSPKMTQLSKIIKKEIG